MLIQVVLKSKSSTSHTHTHGSQLYPCYEIYTNHAASYSRELLSGITAYMKIPFWNVVE